MTKVKSRTKKSNTVTKKSTMTSLHISLPHNLKKQVIARVKEDHFSNPTDYVRNLIRTDALRHKAQKNFDAFIQEGIDSGICKESPEEIITNLKSKLKK